ncbi:MAG: helix-turn-helix domain-containing protein [Chloroflexota bacterium]
MKETTMGNILLIKDRETLKVLTDPLRARIMEAVTLEPLTVKQVARRLGLSPSKLYYHVNMLEKFGFIHVVETNQVGNMLEKTFQTVASHFDIAPSLLSSTTDEGKDALYELVKSTLDTTREDLMRSLQTRFDQLDQGAPEQPRQVMLKRDVRYISDERAEEFKERIFNLLKEFSEHEVTPGKPGAMNYALAIAFYPSFEYTE